MADVAQLVRALDCGSGGRGFKTHRSPHEKMPHLLVGHFLMLHCVELTPKAVGENCQWQFEFSLLDPERRACPNEGKSVKTGALRAKASRAKQDPSFAPSAIINVCLQPN